MPGSTDETLDATSSAVHHAQSQDTLLQTLAPPTVERSPVPRAGSLIGRYVVLERLGSGAMGVVFSAYDPQLERTVALKLLRDPSHDRTSARARLQREAQALARLSHPNVVSVHDVGLHEGQVFLAMEFVRGQTLTRWLKPEPEAPPRPWSEIVPVFMAAGRGLATAHNEGLVHRDFKPDNVMLGDDGRVRVMDFGLARSSEDGSSNAGAPGSDSLTEDDTPRPNGMHSDDSRNAQLTRTGALLGTPAYMAPEQFGGAAATDRSDQFSFCVAFYEALFGTRPFRGDTIGELAYAVTHGEFQPLSREPAVPTWLRRVVQRGLSLDPHERFDSMVAVLDALDAGMLRRRRGRRSLVLVSLGLVVGGGIGLYRYDRTRRLAACANAGDAIDQVWNDGARQALRDGIMATQLPYAQDAADRTVSQIDAYAQTWRTHRTEICTQATVHETRTAEQLDKASWCLEDRQVQLSTLVVQIATTSHKATQRAEQLTTGLPSIETCVDPASLTAMTEPPTAADRPRIIATNKRRSHAEILGALALHDEGLELARRARNEAEQIGWRPLLAKTQATEANLLLSAGAYDRAEPVGIAAYMDAVRAGEWDVAAYVATKLVFIVGYHLMRQSDGLLWAQHAQVAISKYGGPTNALEADLANILGRLHLRHNESDEAKAQFARAITLAEQDHGPDHPRVATASNNLGNVYHSTRDYARARELYERALLIREQTHGPKHPLVASALSNLGTTHAEIGEPERATPLYERAVKIQEQTWGPESPHLYPTLTNLAQALYTQGRYEEAQRTYQRALVITDAALGPSTPDVVPILLGLGYTHLKLDPEDAVPPLQRILDIAQSTPLSDELLADTRFTLAQALWARSAPEADDRLRARALAEEARRSYRDGQLPAKLEQWLATHVP